MAVLAAVSTLLFPTKKELRHSIAFWVPPCCIRCRRLSLDMRWYRGKSFFPTFTLERSQHGVNCYQVFPHFPLPYQHQELHYSYLISSQCTWWWFTDRATHPLCCPLHHCLTWSCKVFSTVIVCLSWAVKFLLWYFLLLLGIFLQGICMTCMTITSSIRRTGHSHSGKGNKGFIHLLIKCTCQFYNGNWSLFLSGAIKRLSYVWLCLHPPSATPPLLGQDLRKPIWSTNTKMNMNENDYSVSLSVHMVKFYWYCAPFCLL